MRMILCSTCANDMLADKLYAFTKKDKCQCCGKKCQCGTCNVVVNASEKGEAVNG